MSPEHEGPPNAIDISGLTLSLGDARILSGIDCSLAAGGVMALLGPSGCGKTTLLKLVAGLLAPSGGSVGIFGATVADAGAGLFVPPERRHLGMVFQDYALWPHLSVGGNVAFPLEMRRIGRAERAAKVASALARVGLAGFADRSPASLSGGQQQRVAIARAIVAEPRLVLFDEPLSNLDRELRETLVGEIAALVRDLGLSALYVTHDQSEAFALADQVAVMQAGRIAQLASPEDLVANPATPAIAELLNLGPVIAAERRPGGWWIAGSGTQLCGAGEGPDDIASAHVLLARTALRLAAPDTAKLAGITVRSRFRGDQHLVTVRLGEDGTATDVVVASDRRAAIGERAGLAFDPALLRWFPSASPLPSTVQQKGSASCAA